MPNPARSNRLIFYNRIQTDEPERGLLCGGLTARASRLPFASGSVANEPRAGNSLAITRLLRYVSERRRTRSQQARRSRSSQSPLRTSLTALKVKVYGRSFKPEGKPFGGLDCASLFIYRLLALFYLQFSQFVNTLSLPR